MARRKGQNYLSGLIRRCRLIGIFFVENITSKWLVILNRGGLNRETRIVTCIFPKNDITARNGIFVPPNIYIEDLTIIFNIYILTISLFIENYLIISRQIFDIIRKKWGNIVYFRSSNKQISKIRKMKRLYDTRVVQAQISIFVCCWI